MKNKNKSFRADAIGSYFRLEWLPIALITVSGLIYNIGLLAGPWFEGRLAQCLADILQAGFGHGAAQIHDDLAWKNDLSISFFTF